MMRNEQVLKIINSNTTKRDLAIKISCAMLISFLVGRLSAESLQNQVSRQYVYSYAIVNNTETTAQRITYLVMKYCTKRKLCPQAYARLLWKESRMIGTKTSYRDGKPLAYGIAQINIKYWEHLFYHADGKRYARRLLSNPAYITTVIYYLGANIDVSTQILRHYLDRYNQDYAKALTAYYAGPSSRAMRRLHNGKSNHYIDDILNPYKGFYDTAITEGWQMIGLTNIIYQLVYKK